MNSPVSASRRNGLKCFSGLVYGSVANLLTLSANAGTASSDPILRPSQQSNRALDAFLLDVATAGQRLIAVGERGVILVSDDEGINWRQTSCPVSSTLTALCFASTQKGWAVGHGGVVLHSADAGSKWALQLDGRRAAAIELAAARAFGNASRLKRAEQNTRDGSDKPLLAVHFDQDGQNGIVCGAYGLVLATQDAGLNWLSWGDRIDNPKGLHLNAIHVQGSYIYLAGEQGLLLRSTDAGKSFTRLDSPYSGSWFTLTGLGGHAADGQFLVAGLRGNAWRSLDAGASFEQSEVPVPVSFSSSSKTRDGRLLLVNQAGMLLSSSDKARSFQILALPPGPPATRVIEANGGTLVAATMKGALRLPKPAA